MSEKNIREQESFEDILKQIETENKPGRAKVDWSKYIPFGWRRLTDEQRALLQGMINRFLEVNRGKK